MDFSHLIDQDFAAFLRFYYFFIIFLGVLWWRFSESQLSVVSDCSTDWGQIISSYI